VINHKSGSNHTYAANLIIFLFYL